MASVESPDNLPDDPAPEELTARFLVDGRHFREDKGQVKARAFQPARDNRTSVFRVAGLDEKGIWNIGDIHVAPRRNKPILGRAELTVGEITSVGLRLEPDNQPYRHANIAGWPSAKDEQKSLTQELALSLGSGSKVKPPNPTIWFCSISLPQRILAALSIAFGLTFISAAASA